jgi:hypothetical protein
MNPNEPFLHHLFKSLQHFFAVVKRGHGSGILAFLITSNKLRYCSAQQLAISSRLDSLMSAANRNCAFNGVALVARPAGDLSVYVFGFYRAAGYLYSHYE